MTTNEQIDHYRRLRAEGLSQGQAVSRLRSDLGLSLNDAADVCWRGETGKRMPDFENDHRARATYDAAHERHLGLTED